MKTYISDIIPKIQSYSKKLDDLSFLLNQNWISLSELKSKKIVYIFRDNSELLIIENGAVNIGSWDYINNQSVIINFQNRPLLFKHGFLDENIMALKIDGSEGYVFFINESKSTYDLNNINSVNLFLHDKYVAKKIFEKKFYCVNPENWKEYGPYTPKEIIKKLKWGRIKKNFYIRGEDSPNYMDLVRISEILDVK
jgi:hypothetical protein